MSAIDNFVNAIHGLGPHQWNGLVQIEIPEGTFPQETRIFMPPNKFDRFKTDMQVTAKEFFELFQELIVEATVPEKRLVATTSFHTMYDRYILVHEVCMDEKPYAVIVIDYLHFVGFANESDPAKDKVTIRFF